MHSDDSYSTHANTQITRSGSTLAEETSSSERLRARFLDMYEVEFPRVVKFVMLCGANLQDAQDAAQEAFADFWQGLISTSNLPQVHDMRAWLRCVAERKYRRPPGARRRPEIVPVIDLPDVPHLGAGHAELTDDVMVVIQALTGIDEDARIVIALDIDEVPAPTIAEYLGITEQRVRDLRKKGRRQFTRNLTGAVHGQEEQWIR